MKSQEKKSSTPTFPAKKGIKVYMTGSHGKQCGECEERQINPKLAQQ